MSFADCDGTHSRFVLEVELMSLAENGWVLTVESGGIEEGGREE